MNLEQAKAEFDKYTSNYDFENPKIKRKYEHSYRVMEKAGRIAENLKLSQEEIEIAKLVGLLHDIGRFEQARIYNNFDDSKTIDHGDLGHQILRESNYIRKYIEDDKYDDVILKAVKNHNKFEIEDGLNEKELLFAKIARDADKWDIFYEGAEIFWKDEEEVKRIGQSNPTYEVLENFMNKKYVKKIKEITPVDKVLYFISLIFDINFDYTYNKIKEEDYINKIMDKFNFEDEETAKIMEEVRNV